MTKEITIEMKVRAVGSIMTKAGKRQMSVDDILAI